MNEKSFMNAVPARRIKAALAVLLGIWLIWDFPTLREVWTPVEPVYDIGTDAVISATLILLR